MKPGAAGGRKRESIQEKGPGPTSHRRWDLGRALSLREASLTSTHWRLGLCMVYGCCYGLSFMVNELFMGMVRVRVRVSVDRKSTRLNSSH